VGVTTRLRLEISQALWDEGFRLPNAVLRGAVVEVDGEVQSVREVGDDWVELSLPLAAPHPLATTPTLRTLEFDLTAGGSLQQTVYERLSMGPQHPRFWRTALPADSEIELVEAPALPSDPFARPDETTWTLAGGRPDDSAAAWSRVEAALGTHLERFAEIDEISIVAVPGLTNPNLQANVIQHCVDRGDRVAVLDSRSIIAPDKASDTPRIRAQAATLRNERGFAALYYPWVEVLRPGTINAMVAPPSGHVAGVYARSDFVRGVHKAPANEIMIGTIGLERRLSDAQQGTLNLEGINCLRIPPQGGVPVVWGARTTARDDRNWQYISTRRLFNWIAESIIEGIRWAVFEPNNLALWQKLTRSITEFLSRVRRDGALFGATDADAFYVAINEALNPEADRRLGRLNIEIGLRPAYPAEFIVIRLGIWEGGATVNQV
jgi:hypothetical protein